MISPGRSDSTENVRPNGHDRAQNATEVATKSSKDSKRTKQLSESLPRGVIIGNWDSSRKKPYYVRYGPNRAYESYANESDRNDRASKLARLQEDEGTKVFEFDPQAWKAYMAFLARTGATLADLERMWDQWHRKPKTTPLVKDAVEAYLVLRLNEDITKDSDTHRHLKKHLRDRFAGYFSAFTLGDLTTQRIREWLADLKNPKTGHPMTNITKRHHRKDVNTFLKRAVAEKWTDENPCESVIPPKIDDEDVSVLKPREIFDLLKANRKELVVGKMCAELFAGLRCSSAERLKSEHLKREDKGIEMPGQVHKSGKRKFRQGQPSVFWKWVSFVPEESWTEVSEKNYDHLKGDAFIRAHVTNSGNCLRHSFASYLLALTKNMATVGYLMQHKHTATTEKYEGVATEADAKLVMAMTPQAVAMTWEDFVSSTTKPKSSPPNNEPPVT